MTERTRDDMPFLFTELLSDFFSSPCDHQCTQHDDVSAVIHTRCTSKLVSISKSEEMTKTSGRMPPPAHRYICMQGQRNRSKNNASAAHRMGSIGVIK